MSSSSQPIQIQTSARLAMWEDIKKEFRDLYRFRYVIITFVQTNLKMRYRRSSLGFLWTILAPLMQYMVIGFVFAHTSRVKHVHFYENFFIGAVVFNIFSIVCNRSTLIMFQNESFIKKIYLPKLLYIVNAVLYEGTNFIFSALALVFLACILGDIHLSWSLLFLPIALLLVVINLIGLGAIFSVISVYFRDLSHIVPVTMQALFFATPIAYSIDIMPEKYRIFAVFNPLYHVIELFRQPIIYQQWPDMQHIWVAAGCGVVVFVVGVLIIKIFDNKIVFKL